MDFIQQCLCLAPVPYLAAAFSALRLIWLSVEQAQASQRQLESLAQSIAHLLQTLDREYRSGRLRQEQTSTPLVDLRRSGYSNCCLFKFSTYRSLPHRLLDEISVFVQREATHGFLKLLFCKDQRIVEIEAYHRNIAMLVNSFQESSHIFGCFTD